MLRVGDAWQSRPRSTHLMPLTATLANRKAVMPAPSSGAVRVRPGLYHAHILVWLRGCQWAEGGCIDGANSAFSKEGTPHVHNHTDANRACWASDAWRACCALW